MFRVFRLPTPRVPNFEGVGQYVAEVFIIAVISFAQSVSVAALMAQKHGYTINPNQVCRTRCKNTVLFYLEAGHVIIRILNIISDSRIGTIISKVPNPILT